MNHHHGSLRTKPQKPRQLTARGLELVVFIDEMETQIDNLFSWLYWLLLDRSSQMKEFFKASRFRGQHVGWVWTQRHRAR